MQNVSLILSTLEGEDELVEKQKQEINKEKNLKRGFFELTI